MLFIIYQILDKHKTKYERNEAISHIISSTNYWKGDTIDNFIYPNNLGIEKAFELAVAHVRKFHYPKLNEEDIKEARKRLKI